MDDRCPYRGKDKKKKKSLNEIQKKTNKIRRNQ